jgi:type IV pilus assembly protein PilN
MRLDINLATQPYEDARRFWVRWGGGLALLAIVTLALLYITLAGWLSARKDRALIRQTEQQIASRDGESRNAQATLNLPEHRSTRDHSNFLNDLFERKAFSWTKVFEDMERVMPPRLHVVAIQPEISKENQVIIKLTVAGDSRDRALELVRRMEGSQRFQRTSIEVENTANVQNTADTIQFQISAIYVPEIEIPMQPAAPVAGKRGAP